MKIVKKLLFSIIALVCVVLTFSVSTYAWFMVNSVAEVHDFEFDVTGGLGFMISIDGEHFSNDLTSEQMKMAIVKGHDPLKYSFSTDGSYLVHTHDKTRVSAEEINKAFKETLLLSPVTSKDGVKFYNLTGSEVSRSSGKFIEFDMWFKTVSQSEGDNVSYDIYLCGEELTQRDGTVIKPTKISSVRDDIKLADSMMYFDKATNKLVNKNAQEKIEVYTSNALRLSAEDTTPAPEIDSETGIAPEVPEKLPPLIYEITNDKDLGSYATDYNKETNIADSSNITEEDRLYNANINAMFTYYNNLRPYSQLDKYLMKYENKPKTVRNLTEVNAEGKVVRSKENRTILNLDAKSMLTRKKKITFRIWLEGWDADCFDGLAKSISVKLVFNSEKMDI